VERGEPHVVRDALVRYVASALIAVGLISILGVILFRRSGQEEALRDAKDETRFAVAWAVRPALTDAVVRGDPKALARFDRTIRRRVLSSSSIVRIKLWTQDGRIVYSDEPRLVGARYPLTPEDREEFVGNRVDAEVSDLSKPENRFERSFGKLIEVYAALSTPTGTPVRYEAYYRSGYISARSRRIFREFAFVMLGALLLLAMIQLPLAWGLARRVRKGQQERSDLLQRAVDASDQERRRIAGDLHDGVVQNLAGVAYSLAAARADAPPNLEPTLDESAAETRRVIRELRGLLVEIYPPELQREGLEAALADLLAPCSARGLETELEVETGGELPPEIAAIFFRASQEALRNVLKHADARRVAVQVGRHDGAASLRVEDDGTGFDPAGRADGAHFGLRLLGDVVEETGGELTVDSEPGRGTTVRVEVPA
jgi:two-component system, NarL family, sensor kinase